MYNKSLINELVKTIYQYNGINDKTKLTKLIQEKYSLIKDRSVFYCDSFALRFSQAESKSFSNTILSLSALQKYDNRPFIVCVVLPTENYLLLANATFLKKISHSSQDLRVDNIRGSFNGSDILRNYEGVDNCSHNFEYLFSSHENFTFEENLCRLVEATNNIAPTGVKFSPTEADKNNIIASVDRAIKFLASKDYGELENDLQNRVNNVKSEIVIASLIGNVNIRGRVIEYLITKADDLQKILIRALHDQTPLPKILTEDKLGDYEREFFNFFTATDIKTKVLFLAGNPKGYNIDKLLKFLATDKSVYLIYIVGIDEKENIFTRLCSMYNNQIIQSTKIIRQWAGRNSRGVTQYDGSALEKILMSFDKGINIDNAINFINKCINL